MADPQTSFDELLSLAEAICRAGLKEQFFVTVCMFPVKDQTGSMALIRSHGSDDFYEAMHSLLKTYEKREKEGSITKRLIGREN